MEKSRGKNKDIGLYPDPDKSLRKVGGRGGKSLRMEDTLRGRLNFALDSGFRQFCAGQVTR